MQTTADGGVHLKFVSEDEVQMDEMEALRNLERLNESEDSTDVTTEESSFSQRTEEAQLELLLPPEAILPLSIVMLVVGTRGDVQPFIGIGKSRGGKGWGVGFRV